MLLRRPDELVPGETVRSLRAVTDLDGTVVSVGFADGRIVNRDAEGLAAGVDVDASDWMLLPPMADLHAHVDKAYTWSAAGSPEGSLEDAVSCWQSFGELLTYEQIKINARRQLTAAMRAGVTAIRTHVNYHEGPDPLRGIRAVIELREEFRGFVDLQVVAMHGYNRESDVIREAIGLGVDLLGDAPHLSPDPQAEIERTVQLAEEAGLGVDIHTDETLNPNSLGIRDLARLTSRWPASMTRSAGHCVSLAMQTPETLAVVLSEAAAAGVSIITNPLTNLYLQGWEHPTATPRALPPLRSILEAGVGLAAGGDNVQDPFNPLGNGDMIDVVAALVLAGHLTPRAAWEVVTAGRGLMNLPRATGAVGDVADMILVRATSVAEAVAERAPERIVIRGGRVIARRRLAIDAVDVSIIEAKEIRA
ncbi:cytosine deaminase [Microbacterium halimionae]|uniref:Cytosine deaminase n=1 Tax=Microbacterium halimionae TaxID=1526413 RepID=A0A7W3PMS1_9MICO|nr:amidohydrolase family protein [Microbacterium halimionae]MBA8817498.1 cytosine deaminase [Microbacterium halimionae]NII95059.1 cytosine deaminase [Microbacterium halimionae]